MRILRPGVPLRPLRAAAVRLPPPQECGPTQSSSPKVQHHHPLPPRAPLRRLTGCLWGRRIRALQPLLLCRGEGYPGLVRRGLGSG